MNSSFISYFDDEKEYPKGIVFNPIPLGILYTYISNIFLNAFINYVDIQKSFILGRHHDWYDDLSENGEITISVSEPGQSPIKKSFKTKQEIYDTLTKPKTAIHPRLDVDFQDDVLILAKAYDESNIKFNWVFFWFDRDNSDCCIGKFNTNDTDEIVIKAFEKFCNNPIRSPYLSKEIPLHYFSSGWISS